MSERAIAELTTALEAERAGRRADRDLAAAAKDGFVAAIAQLRAELETARKLRESLAKECQAAQDIARQAIEQRDAAERTVRRMSERAPDLSEQTAIALGYAERAAANLGDAITALRKEFAS